MKIDNRLFSGLALALAGTMFWANLSWAQGRWGGGPGPWCPLNQTSQDTWQGRGPGNPDCPNYPGYRTRGQGMGMNTQGFQGARGPQGRGMNSQPNNPNTKLRSNE